MEVRGCFGFRGYCFVAPFRGTKLEQVVMDTQ